MTLLRTIVRSRRCFVIVFALLAMGCSTLLTASTQSRGAIHGSVRSGTTPVAFARVTASGGGSLWTTSSDVLGRFHFAELQPGVYGVAAERLGFLTLIISNVDVSAFRETEIVLDLEQSDEEASATVTMETPLLDRRRTCDTSLWLRSDELALLPLLSRDALQLSGGVLGGRLSLDGVTIPDRLIANGLAPLPALAQEFGFSTDGSMTDVQIAQRRGTNTFRFSVNVAYERAEGASDSSPRDQRIAAVEGGGAAIEDLIFFWGSLTSRAFGAERLDTEHAAAVVSADLGKQHHLNAGGTLARADDADRSVLRSFMLDDAVLFSESTFALVEANVTTAELSEADVEQRELLARLSHFASSAAGEHEVKATISNERTEIGPASLTVEQQTFEHLLIRDALTIVTALGHYRVSDGDTIDEDEYLPRIGARWLLTHERRTLLFADWQRYSGSLPELWIDRELDLSSRAFGSSTSVREISIGADHEIIPEFLITVLARKVDWKPFAFEPREVYRTVEAIANKRLSNGWSLRFHTSRQIGDIVDTQPEWSSTLIAAAEVPGGWSAGMVARTSGAFDATAISGDEHHVDRYTTADLRFGKRLRLPQLDVMLHGDIIDIADAGQRSIFADASGVEGRRFVVGIHIER